MKVTIEGKAYFPLNVNATDDGDDVPIEVLGAPDEDLDEGKILLVHNKVSLELSRYDLERALRPFAKD